MIIVIIDTLEQFNELRGWVCQRGLYNRAVRLYGKQAVCLCDSLEYQGWCDAKWYANDHLYRNYPMICYKEYKRRYV